MIRSAKNALILTADALASRRVPSSGVNRWAANTYGTVLSRFDILRAARPGTAIQTLPYLRPGGTLLLSTHGWPKGRTCVAGRRRHRGARYRSGDASTGLLATPAQSPGYSANRSIPIRVSSTGPGSSGGASGYEGAAHISSWATALSVTLTVLPAVAAWSPRLLWNASAKCPDRASTPASRQSLGHR